MQRSHPYSYRSVLLVLLSVFISCNKKMTAPAYTTSPQSFSEVFDNYWNAMNINYVFWDIDTTNWDSIYTTYKPQFAKLDIQNANDQKTAVKLFTEITGGLVDAHYNISFMLPYISGTYIFPAQNRKISSPDFHYPYSYLKDDSAYFDKGYIAAAYNTSDNSQMLVVYAKIKGNILYFHCDHFALYEACNSGINNNAQAVIETFFNNIDNLSDTISGIIIDVRNNNGGNIEDLNFVMQHFTSVPLKFGYTRYKSGNNKLDYTPWIEASITPQTSGKSPLTIPVIVLADNYSISLAEIMTMAIHTLPTGKFVGETTWGATGGITNNVIYNDGSFDIPHTLSVYTASSEFKYLDGKNYEGLGFSPDIAVAFDSTALSVGKDSMLEKAISIIEK